MADHLVNSIDISTESFYSVDAKNYLKSLGFSIETKQPEKFELSITVESVGSTDEAKYLPAVRLKVWLLFIFIKNGGNLV